MSDTTPSPAIPATPETETPKRSRGLINKQYLQDIQDARTVAVAAQEPDHAAALHEADLDPTLPASTIALADKLTGDLGEVVGNRATKSSKVGQHNSATEAIIAALQPIQIAAKRKFKGPDEALRAAYGIGSEPDKPLETIAIAVLKRLQPGENNAPPQDVLPGIKAGPNGRITALANALAHASAKGSEVVTVTNDNASTVEEVKAQLETLAENRREIQLAADQTWPWRTEGVEAIRKAFLLPVDRPLND